MVSGGFTGEGGTIPTLALKGNSYETNGKAVDGNYRLIKEEGPVAVGKSGTDNTSVATNSGKVVG